MAATGKKWPGNCSGQLSVCVFALQTLAGRLPRQLIQHRQVRLALLLGDMSRADSCCAMSPRDRRSSSSLLPCPGGIADLCSISCTSSSIRCASRAESAKSTILFAKFLVPTNGKRGQSDVKAQGPPRACKRQELRVKRSPSTQAAIPDPYHRSMRTCQNQVSESRVRIVTCATTILSARRLFLGDQSPK